MIGSRAYQNRLVFLFLLVFGYSSTYCCSECRSGFIGARARCKLLIQWQFSDWLEKTISLLTLVHLISNIFVRTRIANYRYVLRRNSLWMFHDTTWYFIQIGRCVLIRPWVLIWLKEYCLSLFGLYVKKSVIIGCFSLGSDVVEFTRRVFILLLDYSFSPWKAVLGSPVEIYCAILGSRRVISFLSMRYRSSSFSEMILSSTSLLNILIETAAFMLLVQLIRPDSWQFVVIVLLDAIAEAILWVMSFD